VALTKLDALAQLPELASRRPRSPARAPAGKARRVNPQREMEMRKGVLMAAMLAAGLLGFQGATAEEQAAAEDEEQVTGMVTAADEVTRELVIDEDETFVMADHGGAALWPNVGDRITLFYREEDGEKVITRIGQPVE
jgi:hypothetical protein